MKFTIDDLLSSIAGVLKTKYPDNPIYISPNQQGIKVPCFFIFLMPSMITDEVGERYMRNLGIDVIFVQERNIVNGYSEIYEVLDFLDSNLSVIPYSDGENEAIPIHTFENRSSIEDQELHYQFHVRQRVHIPQTSALMRVLEDSNVKIKDQ